MIDPILRVAVLNDVPSIEALQKHSLRTLSRGFYHASQIESFLRFMPTPRSTDRGTTQRTSLPTAPDTSSGAVAGASEHRRINCLVRSGTRWRMPPEGARHVRSPGHGTSRNQARAARTHRAGYPRARPHDGSRRGAARYPLYERVRATAGRPAPSWFAGRRPHACGPDAQEPRMPSASDVEVIEAQPSSRATGRGEWTSRLGFVLAAAGLGRRLGSIWKFPYITGTNGGGWFCSSHPACVVFVAAPIMVAEILLGRMTRRSPVDAFAALAPERTGELWDGWRSRPDF